MPKGKKPADGLNFSPPPHLSENAKALWSELVPRRARSPERLTLVRVGLEALDRADAARAQVEREGMTTKTRTTGAVHIHPAAKLERESRQLFARCWRDLNLTWDTNLDGSLYEDFGSWH